MVKPEVRVSNSVRDYETNRLRKRPDAAKIESLRTIPTAYVSDFLKQIGIINHRVRGVRAISAFPSEKHVAGCAVTMYFAPVSEAYPYTEAPYMHTEVVEQAEAGDIMVIAGQGAPYGFWGDHTTHQAINQKLDAVVIDGYTGLFYRSHLRVLRPPLRSGRLQHPGRSRRCHGSPG
jgi:regulator of RNase E activity RraA